MKVGSTTKADSAVSMDTILTTQLAECIMGWRTAPGRFLKSGRSWIPRWRFRPLEEIADAFQLLDRATDWFVLTRDRRGAFIAEVVVGGYRGKASGDQHPRVITTAVTRALMRAGRIEITEGASRC